MTFHDIKTSNKGENIHEQHIFLQVHKMIKKRSSKIMWLLEKKFSKCDLGKLRVIEENIVKGLWKYNY